MKKIHLLHNPAAGAAQYDKKSLMKLIRDAGYDCSYSSTKKIGWNSHLLDEDPDIIAVAGGDGTVRKLANELLHRKVLDKNYPVAVLPLGTANNIAKALGMFGEPDRIIRVLSQTKVKRFDVGRIFGLRRHKFFLEGLGYGVFPLLMKTMKKLDEKEIPDDPEEAKMLALRKLYDIITSYKARECRIVTDETDHSGKFLLAEIMNVRSIGPNLNLLPSADPGDGVFDIVLISEAQREAFASYVQSKLDGREESVSFPWMKASSIDIQWEGRNLHVDDEIVTVEKNHRFSVDMRRGLLEFFVPSWKKDAEQK
jgi:diacylglycerol kinase family enzyme